MRKDFATRFWHEAHQSLPAEVRARYLSQKQAAERWELAIARVVQTVSSAKSSIARLFHTKLAH